MQLQSSDKRGDIIQFYNEVFVKVMKHFIISLKNKNDYIYSNPKKSPITSQLNNKKSLKEWIPDSIQETNEVRSRSVVQNK